jgi:hypothetical protein
MRMILAVLALCLGLSGCDVEKANELQKQNDELKGELKKRDAAAQLDMQAKCAKDSKAFVNEKFGGDKDTIMLDFTNHYNVAENKCFVMAEWHYRIAAGHDDWQNDEFLYNVYENEKVGQFAKLTSMYFLGKEYKTNESINTCEVYGSKCKTQEEFNNLITPYLRK